MESSDKMVHVCGVFHLEVVHPESVFELAEMVTEADRYVGPTGETGAREPKPDRHWKPRGVVNHAIHD